MQDHVILWLLRGLVDLLGALYVQDHVILWLLRGRVDL